MPRRHGRLPNCFAGGRSDVEHVKRRAGVEAARVDPKAIPKPATGQAIHDALEPSTPRQAVSMAANGTRGRGAAVVLSCVQ